MPEQDLQRGLAQLQAAEFLYETRLFPDARVHVPARPDPRGRVREPAQRAAARAARADRRHARAPLPGPAGRARRAPGASRLPRRGVGEGARVSPADRDRRPRARAWTPPSSAPRAGPSGGAATTPAPSRSASGTWPIAAGFKNFGLNVVTNLRLGQVYHALGDYRRAADFFTRTIASLQGDLEREHFGMAGLPSVYARAWLAWCLAELGDFPEGIARGEEAVAIAEAADHAYSQVLAAWGLGTLHVVRGDPERAIPVLERGLVRDPHGGHPAPLPVRRRSARRGVCPGRAGRRRPAAPRAGASPGRRPEPPGAPRRSGSRGSGRPSSSRVRSSGPASRRRRRSPSPSDWASGVARPTRGDSPGRSPRRRSRPTARARPPRPATPSAWRPSSGCGRSSRAAAWAPPSSRSRVAAADKARAERAAAVETLPRAGDGPLARPGGGPRRRAGLTSADPAVARGRRRASWRRPSSPRSGARLPRRFYERSVPAGRPGAARLHPGLPARRRPDGGADRRDRGVPRPRGRRLARGVPAVLPLALLRSRGRRVRLPDLRAPRVPERHRRAPRDSGLRPDPRARAARGNRGDGPPPPATAPAPPVGDRARRLDQRAGTAHPGARDHRPRQRPRPAGGPAPPPRGGPAGPARDRHEPADRDQPLARAPAPVLAPRESLRIPASAFYLRPISDLRVLPARWPILSERRDYAAPSVRTPPPSGSRAPLG